MKYDCKNCEYSQLNKDRDKNKKKYCKKCTVDSKDIYGKPPHFKDKKIKPATAGCPLNLRASHLVVGANPTNAIPYLENRIKGSSRPLPP